MFEKLKCPLDQRAGGQAFRNKAQTNQLPLVWDQVDHSRYIQSCLSLLFRKCSLKSGGILIFIFLFMSSLMTLNFWFLCGHNSPSGHRGHHISLRWPGKTPFGSHLSSWEPCHSPSKPWHHRVWGRRCSWSSWEVIPSYPRLSEIIAWEENGFSPILIHAETQGAASEGQKIERKKSTFDDCSSFSFCLIILFYLGNDLSLTTE